MISSRNCLLCEKAVTGDYRKKFCNRSCAAAFNNRKYPKRKAVVEFICKNCKKTFPLFRAKYGFSKRSTCDDCVKIIRQSSIKHPEEKLIENQTKGSLYGRRKNWQSANSTLRRHSREIYSMANHPKMCKICGYDKHIEISHIKSVKDFPDEAKVLEINAIDNLIALCPNHHWEFDNGLIQLKGY